MKKYILASFFLAIAICSYSQTTFGLKGGINLNNTFFTGLEESTSFNSSEDETETQVGFHLGGYATIPLSGKFAFMPEIQFIQKGYRVKSSQDHYRVNINYIELPVMFSYTPVKILSIDLGPVVGIKFSAKARSNGNSADFDDVYDKSLELGVSGGLRFNVSPRFMIASRYYRGLTAINEIVAFDTNMNVTDRIKEFNANVQLSVYYSLTKK